VGVNGDDGKLLLLGVRAMIRGKNHMATGRKSLSSVHQAKEGIFHDGSASCGVETDFDRISEFFRISPCDDPEIYHADSTSFRLPESWFISFYGHWENSGILSTRLSSIEKNGSPLSAIQSRAFLGLITVALSFALMA
jgi:hypothetical protein